MHAADDMTDSDQCAQRQQCSRAGRWALMLFGVLLLGACAGHAPKPPTEAVVTADELPAQDVWDDEEIVDDLIPETEPPVAEIDREIWPRLRAGFQLHDIQHRRVQQEIRLLQRFPNAFRGLMARSEPYLYHILNAVESAGLPAELALLPAIESGFRPHVHSPDGAAGLWQFMPATGRMLGLQRDWWFDKRRTVRASTAAAILYLEQLNEQFSGDWLLTLAAYNAGSGKVSKARRNAARHGRPTDYWSLDLPRETDRYVPRLLALAAVVTDPSAYGLDLPEVLDQPYFAPAKTAGQIDLNVAAQLAGVPVEELLVLNAGNRRWATAPGGPHELLLPVDKVDRFAAALTSLPVDKRLRWSRHHIQPGESLGRIARQYGVTVEAIKRSNGLRDSRIRAGRDLLIPLSDSVTVADTLPTGNSRQRLHYRVRKGDSLYTIARRYQVSVADLRRWNQVGRYIRPGERLTVFIDPDA